MFAAIFLVLMSIMGLCRIIYKFTRFSGESFGMLIAVLFLQQAVKVSCFFLFVRFIQSILTVC